MIKSTRKDRVIPNNKYPCLMVSTLSGMVVLVTSEGEKGHGYKTLAGTIVSEPKDEFYKLGCVGKTWSADVFVPYDGKIILENT